MLVRYLTQLLWLPMTAAYETWHLVDIAQVVCPKPTVSSTAPAFPEYNVGINYTSAMVVDAPHIVSFMRTSNKAVSITFKIEDANGASVVPSTTVNLAAVATTVPNTCTCTNPTIPTAVASTYGTGYGTSCSAWDETNCGDLWGNLTVGAWCCRPWCYASSDCPDAYSSQAIPGQFFSYAACNAVTTPAPSTCQWTAVAQANDPCKCLNKGALFSSAMRNKFSLSYGESCSAWDMQNCATNYRADQVDSWCCSNWCYVDKSCPSAKDSLNDGMTGILYWSDNACPDDTALTLQCPYRPQSNNTPAGDCTCLTEKVPSSVMDWDALGLNSTTYADYGTSCMPWDSQECEKLYPSLSSYAMWCCLSWCWVGETCASARASTLWPGHYFSYDGCEMSADVVSSCKYDDACQCRGELPSGTFDNVEGTFKANYGSSCKPWDSLGCKSTWETNSNSGWSSSNTHDWCCDSWCYVNDSCPIAKQSWLGTGFYFSYETCDDPEWTYNENADTCDGAHRRRYSADNLRRLSARRRSGSFSSSSSYSSRRRTSFSSSSYSYSSTSYRRRSPPAPSTSSRRRSYSAPTSYQPRRRTMTVSPRRRAARRRAPPPPAPAPVNTRRRTSSINGQTYTTTRRRAPASGSTTDVRRRRTAPPTSYGYASRPAVMNNYGGNMPVQTNYGYSGVAKPPNSNANIAMYAVGGAAVGAVAGAGAMYAYNNMYNSDAYGLHRRRRMGNYYDAEWCIVTSTGSRQGDFMECNSCYRLYGYPYCQSGRSCNTAAGCGYTTASTYNRDDLAATGFIPNSYVPPLKVTFTSITGQDIDTDPITGICPPLTATQASLVEEFNKTMSFSPDLFLVLTQQEVLRTETSSCAKDTTTSCTDTCWIDYSQCVSGSCQCRAGYCWNGRTCSATGIGAASTYTIMLPWLMLLLPLIRTLR